jgi:predicted signal transduction protein with EAL and GGDEF domain
VRFGTKLALFLVITLLVIQGATGTALYALIRTTLIDDGEAQLATAVSQFNSQLNEIEHQVAAGMRILALDYALRQAIAQHDHDTTTSALRNQGRRIGAGRMLLVETDGRISADTGDGAMSADTGDGAISADTADGTQHKFPYPALLERAAEQGDATTVAVVEGVPVWLVLVPVLAPDPIAYIVAALPLNDALMARLRVLAALPSAISLVVAPDGKAWRPALGAIDPTVLAHLPPPGQKLAGQPSIVRGRAGEAIFLATALATPKGSPEVATVFLYQLSDALRRFRRLTLVLLVGLAVGLAAAVLGAGAIARGVARPLERLAFYAHRIAAGDYDVPRLAPRRDEIGELSASLGDMAQAIAEREAHIRHQASHEPVTDLVNRTALVAEIDQLLGQRGGVVLVIALTRWQEIANTVGHDIADRLMREAASRLRALVGPVPLGCVSDRSFAAYCPGADLAAAGATAGQIIRQFDLPYREDALTVDATAAVGIALYPAHGGDATRLLRSAEVALQAALRQADRVATYDSEIDPHTPARLSLMSELREGLARGDLHLAYQPKLDLRTMRISGAEALVRWQHPTRGAIAPDSFIGLAEETGNIQQLTRWALRTGIAEAASWRQHGLALRLSINLSVRDLTDADLAQRVMDLLAAADVPPTSLTLEITESAIMGEPESAVALLRRLVDLGIDLAIDDFGVGQSSLAYLRRLPARELKIDRTFVQHMTHNSDDQTIVRSAIELGHNFGCRVTAEGVEDAAAIVLLAGFGCDHAQGYAIAGALEEAEFRGFVSAWRYRGPAEPSVS